MYSFVKKVKLVIKTIFANVQMNYSEAKRWRYAKIAYF
jgi:hypothetical protein